MKTRIYKAEHAVEFDTPERCFIKEVANDPADNSLSVAIARVEPGVTTAWHMLHDVHERYLIITGKGMMEIDSEPAVHVSSGDVISIPAGSRQRITNTSNEDLRFFAVCTPRFEPDCYIEME